ncbi:tandem-95 repeat protein, partial [Thalassospira sp. MA62]|nr:tandem-95 repeat protein [Thalassospira sp. MA62]
MADNDRDNAQEGTSRDTRGDGLNVDTPDEEISREQSQPADDNELVEMHDDQPDSVQTHEQQLGSVHYGNQVVTDQTAEQQAFFRQNAAAQREENREAEAASDRQSVALDVNAQFENAINTGANTPNVARPLAGDDNGDLDVDLTGTGNGGADQSDGAGNGLIGRGSGGSSATLFARGDQNAVPQDDQAGAPASPPIDQPSDAQDLPASDGNDDADDGFDDGVDADTSTPDDAPKVADAPVVTGIDVTGDEDSAIHLDVSAALNDLDGGDETLSVVITGVPDGAVLSAGADNGDGSWTVSVGDLAGLSLTPPENFSGSFDLGITATSREANGSTASSSESFTVNVDGVADGATLTVSDASGREDTAIALDIDTELLDSSEDMSITITGVPDGASLSAGTDNGDGTWALDPADLDGLTFTPARNFSGEIDLTVRVSTTDGDDTAVVMEQLTVDVAGVADAPTLYVADTSGDEDTAIALNIDAGLTDSSEVLSVTISGVPDGATLSAGTDNGDGTWTLNPSQLSGLTITPPENFSGSFDLGVTATSTDGTDTASTSDSLTVDVAGVADTPILDVSDASGQEDSEIDLDVNAGLTDSSETMSIMVSGVPDGARLSAGTDNGDGTWNLSPSDLENLRIEAADNYSGSFDLTVTVTSTDGDDTNSISDTITVDVTGVADDPTLDVSDASGNEDTAIALDINAGLTDSSEVLSVTISGVPEGATLSAGTNNGDGSWTLNPSQLSGLTITPPENFSGSFDLGVTATSTDGSDTASVGDTITVDVTGVADDPTLDVSDASGNEDTAIALDIDAGLTDSSEVLSVTISGVPDGATLSTGTDNGDGSWTLSPAQLPGLTITPPENFSGSFDLGVTATSTDGSDTATTSDSLTVDVAGVADDPTLDVSDASGNEDTAIALDIDAGLTDSSEVLSVTISGVPDGATLSAGTNNGDGSWTLNPSQLSGLTITPPENFSGSFELGVTATSTDGSDTATTSDSLTVDVAGVADDPTLDVANASGNEDTAIALDIDAGLTDSSEVLAVTISGVPDGASLSAGTDNGDGTWTLSPAQLSGLTITPPENFSGSFDLGVTATSTDGSDTASVGDTITVDVAGVADDPTLDVSDASGNEDTAIALDIDAGLTDSSEVLAVTISGVPDGASLSAGTNNGDGSWTLSPSQLSGLTITPPENFSGSFDLGVTATSTDGSDTATTSDSLTVDVTGVADDPTLDVSDASGNEDTAIALDIDAGLTDSSEVLAVTISGVPDGATLSAGTDNGDGSWTLSPAQLSGLTITPPENYSG